MPFEGAAPLASLADVINLNWIIAVGGLIVLFILAVTIGMSTDTDAQHRAAQAAAEEIRQLNEARHELEKLNWAVWAERQELAKQRAELNMCQQCPFRGNR